MTMSIVVDVDLRPDALDAIWQALAEFVRRTAAEEGNLRFEAYVDASVPDKLVIFEEWADEAAHHAHTELEHTKEFRNAVAGALQGPPRARRLKPIARGELSPQADVTDPAHG